MTSAPQLFLAVTRRRPEGLLYLVCALFVAGPLMAQQAAPAPIGLWDGAIQSRAGEVDFNIELRQQPAGALQAALINATDRQPFSSATWNESVAPSHCA